MFNSKYVEIHNYNSTHVNIQTWMLFRCTRSNYHTQGITSHVIVSCHLKSTYYWTSNVNTNNTHFGTPMMFLCFILCLFLT